MKILKAILWPILIFGLVWISAILFGPPLITTAASYFSDGSVKLTRVEVSPKLSVSAAAVDFNLFPLVDEAGLIGVARAVSVNWKIKNGFELVGKIGPTKLKEKGFLSSASFTLKPRSFIDWREVDLILEFEQLDLNSFEFERGRFTATLNNALHQLNDIDIFLPKFSGELAGNLFEATALKIKMDRHDIDLRRIQKDSEITYSLKQIVIPKIAFEGIKIKGDMTLFDEELLFRLAASDAELTRKGIKAESLILSFKHPLSSEVFDGLWEFAISKIELKSPAIKIENYSGQLASKASGVTHSGRATIPKLELKSDKYFIGNIENGILDFNLISHAFPKRTDIEGRAVLTLRDVDGFSATGLIKTSLSQSDILDCIIFNCSFGTTKADYQITASGSSLKGNFMCEETDCFTRPKKHVLQTDNTNNFFQALSSTGILSPLTLPIAYLAITSGKASGDGHILNF